MKVLHSTVNLLAAQSSLTHTRTQTTVQWQTRADKPAAPPFRPADPVRAGPWVPARTGPDMVPPCDASACVEGIDPALAPRWMVMARMIEAITGMAVRTLRPGDWHRPPRQSAAELAATDRPTPPPQTPTGSAPATATVRHERTHTRMESVRFQADGVVQMADGRTQAIRLTLDMDSVHTESTVDEVHLGTREPVRLQDPLVIHFDGPVADLSGRRFQFDLDADGRTEAMPFVGSGSGFLALDLNQNGQIDDGRELFGALSGNGFADLATHDTDSNGWIDSGDAVFDRLLVWRQDATGHTTLTPLAQTGVGALGLASATTDMALYGRNGQAATSTLLGQLRRTGIYLTESGGAGVLQHIDLAV